MARTVFGIPLHFVIIPGYLIAVILLFFANKDFVAMAFDSGSIATGPLTVAFMVSLTVGVSDALDGRNMIVDGFGLIGIITLAPIISIQLLSLIYAVKTARGEVSDDSGK
jgi:hypothetical protein